MPSVYDAFQDQDPAVPEEEIDDEFEAISVWDQLGEALIRAGIGSGELRWITTFSRIELSHFRGRVDIA